MSDEEALKPANVDMSRFQIQSSNVVDNTTGTRKRGPGRPKGSPNKTKVPEGGINPPAKLDLSGGRRNPPKQPATEEDENKRRREQEAKAQAKKEAAERYSTWINEELNDKLFMFIIGGGLGFKVPPEMIYKDGKVPLKAASNPNLSELGNALSIPSDVADSWGKLAAELTYTEQGQKVVNTVSGGPIAILGLAAGAIFSTYRYTQQLQGVRQELANFQQFLQDQNTKQDEHG